MVLHFAETTDEDRFMRLENRGTEIRKTLMGTLLLADDVFKDDLLKSREGQEVIKEMEKAEETFVDTSLKERFARLENIFDVINKRSKGLYLLMEYLSKRNNET